MRTKLVDLYRLILSDKNTRNLFFFLSLNLVFAFVELFYGLATNSLGLISDSFHMFFDCSAILLGLAASIVAKWTPSDRFTYGFGRAEILAGLANGLFLLFIAIFISIQAIQRAFKPPEVYHERLFVVSVLGFIVNLIGIFVFQHGGQDHRHHSHQASNISSTNKLHNHNHRVEYKRANVHGSNHSSVTMILDEDQQSTSSFVALNMKTLEQPKDNNANHQQDHNNRRLTSDVQVSLSNEPITKTRSFNGRGQVMQSVLLHIIADTLGSIGVIVSAVLMDQFGWLVADPLCSLFIAILISISVCPLLRDSFYILMQRIPVDIEKALPGCLFEIQGLSGVVSVRDVHLWTLNSGTYIGCLKLDATRGADHGYITSNACRLLKHIGVDNIHIQVDYIVLDSPGRDSSGQIPENQKKIDEGPNEKTKL